MIKKVIFRADGNSTTGLGHLYRLFSLVEAVKDNLEFVFVTHETSIDSIIPKIYSIVIIPKEISTADEPDWLEANFSSKEYIIIADGYQFTSTYQNHIKEKGYQLIYIDDLAKEHMYADLVINHSPYIQEKHYKKEAYTQLALGTKYALLRPLFLKAAKRNRVIKTLDSAFVCFGGADPYNLTLKAVQGLLEIPNFKNIHVVLGGAYKHKEIFDLEEAHSDTVKIYNNLSEESLIKTMQKCNFAIAPASTILFELCCVKMPILAGFYVDNQKYIYKGLTQKNAIIDGGDFSNYDSSDFKHKVLSILDTKAIDLFLENQYKLFDGHSNTRLLGLINRLHITFKSAEEADVLQVYNWSNDALVRKNSYDSDPIKLENHKKWFSKKIKDENTIFLIALVNDIPAGVVRYEIGHEHSLVGILVAKEFRGQKLAADFLINSATYYFNICALPVLAYIKAENKASIKSFENAGYTYFKDEKMNEISSFVYKLEKRDVKR